MREESRVRRDRRVALKAAKERLEHLRRLADHPELKVWMPDGSFRRVTSRDVAVASAELEHAVEGVLEFIWAKADEAFYANKRVDPRWPYGADTSHYNKGYGASSVPRLAYNAPEELREAEARYTATVKADERRLAARMAEFAARSDDQ